MNRLNVNCLVPNGVLLGGELTPKTPEIVNSLLAMRNPLDSYRAKDPSADEPPDPLTVTQLVAVESSNPPSIQHTCSQLIKEGLKLTLQTKRKANCGTTSENRKGRGRRKEYASSEDYDSGAGRSGSGGGGSGGRSAQTGHLTPEDEERRRRRRERNKIAATKCRLKKRRKTVILVQESEILETQNCELKLQIDELENQRRRLIELLHVHDPNCVKNGGGVQQQQQYPQHQQTFTIHQHPIHQQELIIPIKAEDYYGQN